MAIQTKEQLEQKMQQLKQLAEEVKALTKELVEAGAIELSEDDLYQVAGGKKVSPGETLPPQPLEEAPRWPSHDYYSEALGRLYGGKK